MSDVVPRLILPKWALQAEVLQGSRLFLVWSTAAAADVLQTRTSFRAVSA
jgi:hypothetical protein